jgi:hypothetical protein
MKVFVAGHHAVVSLATSIPAGPAHIGNSQERG